MKNVQTCHCGASNCRGILGPRSKQSKVLEVATATVNATVKGVKRKMAELVRGAATNASASPKKGGPRGPYKKRRVSAPAALRKAVSKSTPKKGRKGQRVASSASDKTLVDKENKTPSTKSGRSSSNNSFAQDSVTRKAASLKREPSSMSLKSTQSTLESWFRGPSSTLKRVMTTNPLGSSGSKRSSLNDSGKARVQKRTSLPARLPGARTSSRLMEHHDTDDKASDTKPADDDWVSIGVRGKGKWKYVPVVA